MIEIVNTTTSRLVLFIKGLTMSLCCCFFGIFTCTNVNGDFYCQLQASGNTCYFVLTIKYVPSDPKNAPVQGVVSRATFNSNCHSLLLILLSI